MSTPPRFTVQSIEEIPDSTSEYKLTFRGDDDQLHQVVASIDQNQGLGIVNYAPHDPVFSMRDGDDPRPQASGTVCACRRMKSRKSWAGIGRANR